MPVNVLVIDIGGTHVKLLATGQAQERAFVSGPNLTPKRMVAQDFGCGKMAEALSRCDDALERVNQRFRRFEV